jgi:hypothetical protein
MLEKQNTVATIGFSPQYYGTLNALHQHGQFFADSNYNDHLKGLRVEVYMKENRCILIVAN